MRVSLNLVKKYVDLPKNLTDQQIAYDLTLRTVEVESVENTADKFHDIVVGKILEVRNHPNADLLKICITDIGEDKPVQIVCGGSNLYEGEYVVVSKPGAEVVWHGEGEPVKIKETKMRGENSYGMICGATEVYLDKFFPPKDDHEIVDLKDISCVPGQNISEVICMDDVVLEIDNKSLTNRPDLWGHYGIARELSAIYDVPLKKLPEVNLDPTLPEYSVLIEDTKKCQRYVAMEIDGVYDTESPMWMKAALVNTGMRPINAIVDITNYIMMAVGQPLHAFDKTHVEGQKIVVRNAKKNEKLLLLDNNEIDLTEEDLVICDTQDAMALAGIKGGKKDSILPDTTGIVLEIANFTAGTIRNTGKRFDEKTDASIRYEKNIDTERVLQGMSLALVLFKEIFPESKIVSFKDNYPVQTIRQKIDISQEFLNVRLGKVLTKETVIKVLQNLGYDVTFEKGIYHVIVPVWRSTGDVSIKDDVMGDIARLLSYESFEATPLTIDIHHAILQNKVLLERRIKEYLALRCGFNEIFTYPWIDEKYIKAARINVLDCIQLETPPAPELKYLRSSLIPGMLEAVTKNLKYISSFKIFELAQVFEKGVYHPSTNEESLPIHKKYITGCIVDKDAKSIFYEIKGIIENMSSLCHMEELEFRKEIQPSWADKEVYLNIICKKEIIGSIGLMSVLSMSESKIKRTNVAFFELDFDKLIPFASRDNQFKHLPQIPLIEKDLSFIIDESLTWQEISLAVLPKVNDLEFVEEYRGDQIPKGKKSITLRIKIGNGKSTLTSEEINDEMNKVVKILDKKFGAILREE